MQRLTDEQRRLVEENLPLVAYTMKNKIPYVYRDDWDDVFQEGAIGLCRAAAAYDPMLGKEFVTLAVPCIVNQIYMFLRKRNSKGRRLERSACSLDKEYDINGETDKTSLCNMLAAREDVESEFAANDLMDYIDRSMTKREKEIVSMLLEEMRQVDIGKRLGISQSYVSRCIHRIERRVQLYSMGCPERTAS